MALILAAALLPALACDKESPSAARPPADPAAGHQDEAEHAALPRQLRLAPDEAREAGIATQVAKRAALTAVVTLPGDLVSEPDKTASVSAIAAGRLESVAFNEGAHVKKGDVLAILRIPDVGRLRGAFAATTAKAKASRANANRLRALKESGLGAEQAVVDAEAEAHAQEAEAFALTEQLSAIGATAQSATGYLVPMRAPITGVAVSRDAVVGQPVNADHVIATIVDLSEMWFIGRVFEKDLGRLSVGARAAVQLNAFPGETFEGFVEYLGQRTDPVARTLTARIRLRNDGDHLRIGLFGSAQVEVGGTTAATAQVIVPRSAVTEVGGKPVVFVVAADGDYVLHEVTLGNAALAQVEILSGIDEGEQVVIGGVFTLKSMVLKSTLSEGEQ